MRMSLAWITLVALLLAGGCDDYTGAGAGGNGGVAQPRAAAASTVTRAGRYEPLYPARRDWQQFQPGTINYDFNHAAASATLDEARVRWEKYVQAHREVQDGFTSNYLVGAKIELMRVYYMQGQNAKADDILKEFDLTLLAPSVAR